MIRVAVLLGWNAIKNHLLEYLQHDDCQVFCSSLSLLSAKVENRIKGFNTSYGFKLSTFNDPLPISNPFFYFPPHFSDNCSSCLPCCIGYEILSVLTLIVVGKLIIIKHISVVICYSVKELPALPCLVWTCIISDKLPYYSYLA